MGIWLQGDYRRVLKESQLVIDTRNATRKLRGEAGPPATLEVVSGADQTGIAGTVLRGQQAQEMLIGYLRQTIPGAVDLPYEQILTSLAENSTGILSVGTLFFLWIATRLVAVTRSPLRR